MAQREWSKEADRQHANHDISGSSSGELPEPLHDFGAGDLITTGTPPGVGMGQKPAPQYLRPGDLIELGISGLGSQRQRVVEWKET